MAGEYVRFEALPVGWTIQRVGDFAEVKGGKRLPAGTSLTEKRTAHPYLRIVDFRDGRIDRSNLMFVPDDVFPKISRYTISSKDVWISIVGTVGLVGLIDEDLDGANLTENAAKICHIASHVDKTYLALFLRSKYGREEIQARTVGSTQPKLALFRIEDIRVPLPPLPEQRAIAHILGTLDDKIELNRKQNETLEAMARALFKAWFVDFEPVRAKMEGRWQRGLSLPGLPAHLYDLFPDRLVESELGKIPEGWEVTAIDGEFDVTMGQSPPGSTYNETGDGLPFYQGRADFEFRFPKRRVYCTAPTRFAKKGDTLVSVRAPVGDINMASEDCAIGRGVAAVRHKTGCRSYTYQFMNSISDVFARFDSEGTVFGSIGKKDFHAITHVRPSHDLVLAYEGLAAPLDDQIERNERESRYLAQLRDTLLPKLISGELRVHDAERFLKERGL